MKRLIGVFVITSVVAIGLYLYSRIPTDKNVTENTPPAPATVSEPLNDETVAKDESSKKLEEKQEENKQQLPDLESLKGLEEESSDLFEAINDLPEGGEGDPLKDVLQ